MARTHKATSLSFKDEDEKWIDWRCAVLHFKTRSQYFYHLYMNDRARVEQGQTSFEIVAEPKTVYNVTMSGIDHSTMTNTIVDEAVDPPKSPKDKK